MIQFSDVVKIGEKKKEKAGQPVSNLLTGIVQIRHVYVEHDFNETFHICNTMELSFAVFFSSSFPSLSGFLTIRNRKTKSLWTCLEFGACKQATCQQSACLNGDRCQLQLALQDVPDGVDVGNIGLLLIIDRDFSIPGK